MDSNHWPSGYEPDELPNCSTPPENELHCIIKKNKKEKQESKKSRLPFFFLLCCIYPLRMTNKETSWKERKTNVVLSTNVVYFARKEQCLALGKQLRSNFKIQDYRIFRLFPSGEVQFIHPKDGVFPEKVNEGRMAVGKREFSIGQNPNPVTMKFTGTSTFEGEERKKN